MPNRYMSKRYSEEVAPAVSDVKSSFNHYNFTKTVVPIAIVVAQKMKAAPKIANFNVVYELKTVFI